MKRGVSFLLLSVLVFFGLALEAVVGFGVEPPLYGRAMDEWSIVQMILHWLITSFLWGMVSFLLLRYSLKKWGLDLLNQRERLSKSQWIFALVALAICIVVGFWDWQGFKPAIELAHNGGVKFIFQYVYYVFETVLVLLMVAFGQEAGESIFSKTGKIPWGGIVTAILWGLPHILTKGSISAGIVAVDALLFGVIYLFTRKNTYVSYLLIFLGFVI
ncbi:hypothetical protein SAMN02745116_00913 [Pilibacter termitis]|uniref:CAAX protease self-immunity n=1 Tax=Pilibacter termitis TaxID=263852 RepID=A0A1T4M3S5_9ENTE|nr:hypothetical protein [Pilibacter termitis]SJZ61547.1 hypothetical protein SAMN02745116_00913 [Pilibacter termitis]